MADSIAKREARVKDADYPAPFASRANESG
jgi:hypothetical protein